MRWKTGIYAGAVVLLACFGMQQANAQDNWRVIGTEQIRRMNQFERVQYTKALNLLNQRQYKAAATEFERYLTQFSSSEMLPYIIFLRAYSLHCANVRNAAIGVYNEVLDFYPDEIDAAAPALYYRGVAQLDNGDYSKGMQSMKQLVDDEDYRNHAVAAAAGIKLVQNHWKNKDFAKGENYLRQIIANFRDRAPGISKNALDLYGAYVICNKGKSKEFERWYIDTFRKSNAKVQKNENQLRINLVQIPFNTFIYNYRNYYMDQNRNLYTGAKRTEPAKELWGLLSSNKDAFLKEKDAWGFYFRAFLLTADKPELIKDGDLQKLVQEAIAEVGKVPDDAKNKGRQQKRYQEMFDALVNGGRIQAAELVNSKISSKKDRQWNCYRIVARQENWNDAIKELDSAIEQFGKDGEYMRKCMYEKGWLLEDKLKKYDEAIKVYSTVSNPPKTLWRIQSCHQRKGDLPSALKVLVEIENAFPDEAPEAAWRRAEYQDRAGNGDQAVKEGRMIMKKYPKSMQSSRAHQLLERYGIDTGGAIRD